MKKVSAAFTALGADDNQMEETIATVGAFMAEMRSVGLSARDVVLAETMARRLAAVQGRCTLWRELRSSSLLDCPMEARQHRLQAVDGSLALLTHLLESNDLALFSTAPMISFMSSLKQQRSYLSWQSAKVLQPLRLGERRLYVIRRSRINCAKPARVIAFIDFPDSTPSTLTGIVGIISASAFFRSTLRRCTPAWNAASARVNHVYIYYSYVNSISR
ncbi:hypothetical protein PHYPSEUDO_001338 [Phytophthora pseudosyringae]|uniref:Uncharacterized protein n=1 Tax=Phytophthora pseudosyringae TaxID=221518 RepID=A0A8T1WIP1_9STRA|nr:hypothetical protein PHYPSEUDO_001338 [Phytophthora pseudosyringae]